MLFQTIEFSCEMEDRDGTWWSDNVNFLIIRKVPC